jgi:hypothetical protein
MKKLIKNAIKALALALKEMTLDMYGFAQDVIFVTMFVSVFFLIPIYFVTNIDIRRIEYGPLLFLSVWYLPISLIFKFRHNQIAYSIMTRRRVAGEKLDPSFQHFFNLAPYFFLAFVLIPYIFFDSVEEALNPMGYWTAKANVKNECQLSNELQRDLRENVIVAANKLRMGIGTTRELQEAQSTLNLMNGTFEDCDLRYKHEIQIAKNKLLELRNPNPPASQNVPIAKETANSKLEEGKWEDVPMKAARTGKPTSTHLPAGYTWEEAPDAAKSPSNIPGE